ncbi:MAG: TRAP transporter large permease subunit [Caldilineaceae bacterium]|nr:TRAP transporter large permease subunit [Caldilineaceae bacterium]
MGYEWLAILMFVGFFFLLLSGFPVAYSFAGTALIFGLLGLAFDAFDVALLRLLPNRWFGTMSDFTLLAIPYFIFLGSVFEKSGLAEEMLETIGILLGPLRGGMALAVILVGTLLAATTGVVAATVIVMGLMSLPVMLRYGYDKQLAAGVIISSGTMAQLIPPSLVLVVLSDQIGVRIGDLFLGAIIPGLILAASYAAYVLLVALVKPEAAPALPKEARTLSGGKLLLRVLGSVIPAALLIVAVLGSIFTGLASPTESASVGAVGASLLALITGAIKGRFNPRIFWEAAKATAHLTALVIMILFCSTFFSMVFDGLGGQRLMTSLLTAVPGGFIGFILVSNIAIFLLGIFLEFIEISFIAMPLFVPAANALGIDMVWFGVVMAINLQMAFISPPVGFSLFYLQSVAPPELPTSEIHKSAVPFMVIQAIVLVIVIAFPQTVRWLVDLSAQYQLAR